MKKNLVKLLASASIISLSACSQSSNGSNGSNSNDGADSPKPAQVAADQLKIVMAGQVPLLNGAQATIDAIIYNTTGAPVNNATFSLNGVANAKITSYNGCDKIIAPNSECRVSLQFNAMKNTQSVLSQPLTVNYINTYGAHKSSSMLYNAVRIATDGTTPKLINPSIPSTLTDIGNSHLRGVTYVMVQNPKQASYSLKSATFSSSAFSIIGLSYAIGSQLNDGALIQVEYDASKSTSLNSADLQAGKNGGFSKLILQDSLSTPLTLNATSDYITGGYLVTGVLNPLNSSTSQSETLIITNVGSTDVSGVTLNDDMGILNFNGGQSTVPANGTITPTVAATPGSSGVTNITVASNVNNTIVPVTVYTDPQPLVVLQNTSYLFASTVGQTKSITITNSSNQNIHVSNVTFTKDSKSAASISVTGDSCSGQSIVAGGNCTISGVTINSAIDEQSSSVTVNMAYTYNGGASTVLLSPIGRILYQSVLRQSVSIIAPSSFEVVGNNTAISYESVIVTNTSSLHPVTVESWNMTNNNSSSSWMKINNNGSCASGTILQAESANNCTFGITLGPVNLNNPGETINSNESLSVSFTTKPLTTDSLVGTGVVPFQVTLGNQSYISLQSYTPANNIAGTGTSANPYNFLGSTAGSSKTMALNFVNTSGSPIKVNAVQHLANPFYWASNTDTCSGNTLQANESCTVAYYDSLYQNIANTTQSGSNVINNLTLPQFIITQLSTNWTFAVPAINPNTNDNTVYSSVAILLLDHSVSSQTTNNNLVNIITQLSVGANDNISNYQFTESANIAGNSIIESSGYTMYSGSSCNVSAASSGLISQVCTYNGANPYGVSYISSTGGQAGDAVGLSTAYFVTPTGNQQAIAQKQNYFTINVN